MERSGFVERARDESDRRATRLRLTSQGEDVVADVVAVWRDAEAEMSESLAADERAQLLSLLRRIAEN